MKMRCAGMALAFWLVACDDGSKTQTPPPLLTAEELTVVRDSVPYVNTIDCGHASNGTQVLYMHLENDTNQRCFDPASDTDCNTDIDVFDTTTGSLEPLTETPFQEFVFTVDGGNAFWLYNAIELRAASLITGDEQSRGIDSLMTIVQGMKAAGGKIAIAQTTLTGETASIAVLDNFTANVETVSPELPILLSFGFDGQRVAWGDLSDDSNQDCSIYSATDTDCFVRLMVHDLTTDMTTELLTGEGIGLIIPRVCGDWVVFLDQRDDPDAQCDSDTCIQHVTAVHRTTLETKRLFSEFVSGVPACDGNRVVATIASENDTNRRCFSDSTDLDCARAVLLYDLNTDEQFRLLDDAPYSCPTIAGDRLTQESRPFQCALPEFDPNCAASILTVEVPL